MAFRFLLAHAGRFESRSQPVTGAPDNLKPGPETRTPGESDHRLAGPARDHGARLSDSERRTSSRDWARLGEP
jgi:hypothetical protein